MMTGSSTLSLFDLGALLLTLSAAFAWLNHKLFNLPNTIGVLLMGLASSLVLIGIRLTMQIGVDEALTSAIRQIDFTAALMNGMLAFLLFAGALHVDFSRLRSRAFQVALLATVGVVLSTAIVGIGLYLLARVLGVPVSLAWALVFGALISPTDPVAVLSTLKTVHMPPALEIEIAGEALFNDGVGIVLFTILVAMAASGSEFSLVGIGELFFIEALGGALLGLATGYLAYRAMAALDDYPVEVLISLALV